MSERLNRLALLEVKRLEMRQQLFVIEGLQDDIRRLTDPLFVKPEDLDEASLKSRIEVLCEKLPAYRELRAHVARIKDEVGQ
jgi:hypothetical protein